MGDVPPFRAAACRAKLRAEQVGNFRGSTKPCRRHHDSSERVTCTSTKTSERACAALDSSTLCQLASAFSPSFSATLLVRAISRSEAKSSRLAASTRCSRAPNCTSDVDGS
eukprot:scaffold116081_cov30-Tisochrysis_lutea.AAC.1